MDPASLLSNPQFACLLQDPEIMSLMNRPDLMAKFQAMMQNPEQAQQHLQDPDVMRIVSKLQGTMMGGGGGGMSGRSPFPSPSSASTSSSSHSSIRTINSLPDFNSLLSTAGSKPVLVDFYTTWCSPCKVIAPVFEECAAVYSDSVMFVKCDGDLCRDVCTQQAITAFPTFQLFHKGHKVEEFRGANEKELRRMCSEWSQRAVMPEASYQHFPLKEAEQVKYDDIKWPLVEQKLMEFNTLLTNQSIQHPAALSTQGLVSEWLDIERLIKGLKDKTTWHSTEFNQATYDILVKLLSWPLDKITPTLNLLRIVVLHPHAATVLSRGNVEKVEMNVGVTKRPAVWRIDLVGRLCDIACQTEKSTVALLCLRCLCNMFARRAAARVMMLNENFERVLDKTTQLIQKHNLDENLRLSALALLINYCVAFTTQSDVEEAAKIQLLTSIVDVLNVDVAGETGSHAKLVYRCAVIIGSLIYKDENTRSIAVDLEVDKLIEQQAEKYKSTDQQVKEVAEELRKALKTPNK